MSGSGDAVTREVTIPVAPEQAWAAMVEPELLAQWFGRPSGPIEVGTEIVFSFETDNGTERGRARVLSVDPGAEVSFSWLPGPASAWNGVLDRDAPLDELPTTTATWRLTAVDGGRSSKITVTESGFSGLPAQVAAKMLEGNTHGWEICLGRMETLLAGTHAAAAR
jgi:uncharacterized protein YndB with AHSA1/START domain